MKNALKTFVWLVGATHWVAKHSVRVAAYKHLHTSTGSVFGGARWLSVLKASARRRKSRWLSNCL